MPEHFDPPELTPPDELRRIGPYRVLRKLAQGGMSSVYVAYDEIEQKNVAIKVLAAHLQDQPEFVRRFKREARLLQLLRHPNIVRGLHSDYDRTAEKRYLSMDFVDGPTAASLLAETKAIPGQMVARIGIEIAAALGFLHGLRFVHRDVKPDNILLDTQGTARLIDFGLIKKLDGGADLTASNQGVGTPYYMPYEQMQNSSLVDGRSDLFALGATLYHLATGQLPFPGRSEVELDFKKGSGSFSPISPLLGRELARVLSKAMTKEVRNRYQTAYELIHDLEPIAATTAELAHFISLHTNGLAGETDHHAPTRTDLPRPHTSAKLRPNSRPPKAVAIIALAALMAGSALLLKRCPDTNDCCECDPVSQCRKCELISLSHLSCNG